MNHRTRNTTQAFLVALLFCFTVVIVAPLHVHITNQFEFVFTSADLFKQLLPISLICVAGLTLLLTLLRGNARRVVLSVLFMLSLLLWLQGNLLVWDYGALDGRDIDWVGMWYLGLLDGALWLLGLGLAVRYSSWMTHNLVNISSVFLILIQCVSIYSGLSNQPPVDRYRVDERGKYTFSSQQNVILIVVDAFQTDVFQEIIDDDPALKDVFDGFVYFRNAVSGFRQSYPSIPNILTATYFDNSKPMWDYLRDAYLSKSSLPKFFNDNGYKSEVYESKPGLYINPAVITNASPSTDYVQASSDILYNLDVALFRYIPHFLKKLVYNNQLWFLSYQFSQNSSITNTAGNANKAADGETAGYIDLSKRPAKTHFTEDALAKLSNLRVANHFINYSKVGYEQPVFKYFHMLGTHLPIRMTHDFQYVEPERSRTSLKDLSVGVVGLVDLILGSFRELGIFDNALIIVTADHGMWTKVAEVKIPDYLTQLHGESGSIARNLLPERIGTALPLVLIKRIGAQGTMRTNDAPIALSDIPRTVVTELGFEASSFPGKSMFNVPENETRKRLVHYSTFAQNPAYSEPFRSTMTEFIVEGFSWLDTSWIKTGKTYPPASDK